MKIGYSAEGSTDRALLEGLRRRWCPKAERVEGRFRGRSGLSQRREIPNTCIELTSKGVDLVLFLRDANDENWRDVLKADAARCRAEHEHLTIFGVCDRNVECWLCTDRDWIAIQTGRRSEDFNVDDPKGVLESALGITARGRKIEEIAGLVETAPLHKWLGNRSFEDFYDKLWQKSKQLDCRVENLRARQ